VKYQEVNFCETTPGVTTYKGYITVPSGAYSAKLFFWFFSARTDASSAPLTVWLQGGPGAATMPQVVSGHNGPCIVQDDSTTTVINQWSWNKASNMLYIDQPVQTGFSYDEVVEQVLNMVDGSFLPATEPTSMTRRPGKFSSGNPAQTVSTTETAARAVGRFLELWFDEHPQYEREKINVWSQSYGGHYAPALAHLLHPDTPNKPEGVPSIGINSVGILNGIIDLVEQARAYPDFAVNNTYDIQTITPAQAATAVSNLESPGGCYDLADACRAAQAQFDPANEGDNPAVFGPCFEAFNACWGNVYAVYEAFSGRNPFDITYPVQGSLSKPWGIGYLNDPDVREWLGAAVNFTEFSSTVQSGFVPTGDFFRSYMDELAFLLNKGVKVALAYGDRDYRANWFGGEDVSKAIPWDHKTRFGNAGYVDIRNTLAGSSQGKVRQYGPLSFSRIYQAGHEPPYQKAQVSYEIFRRTIKNLDVSTGIIPGVSTLRVPFTNPKQYIYRTMGAASVRGVKQAPGPDDRSILCYVDAAPLVNRCTANQIAALEDGTAVVNEKRVVVSPAPV